MGDKTYFALAMLFNHCWKFGLVIIALFLLFGCGPVDCPDSEKVEKQSCTHLEYDYIECSLNYVCGAN